MTTVFDVRDFLNTLSGVYLLDETAAVDDLISKLTLTMEDRKTIQSAAIRFVTAARTLKLRPSLAEHIMRRYPLNTPEGIDMMCLSESFLRIPDDGTKNILLRDKLSRGNFWRDVGGKTPFWMRGLSGGLHLFSKIAKGSDRSLITKSALKMATPIVTRLMQTMANHFVYAPTMEEALTKSAPFNAKGYSHSFDMLGEGAMTMDDAGRYLYAYRDGIDAAGAFNQKQTNLKDHAAISIKLSAIYPRYEPSQENRVQSELGPQLKSLVLYAKSKNVPLTIDAEESGRLGLSLILLDYLLQDPEIAAWEKGLGIAVQAYQKRAPYVIDGLAAMAHYYKTKLCVRLVKGAYWDSEIKTAQENGLDGYPVFTRKEATDLSYLVCAEKLFGATQALYPQFATHNAMTVCAVAHMAAGRDYECQKLHGMGDHVYEIALSNQIIPHCRIYAPIGAHRDLLPYLVRRLLENGANTSFINHMADETISPETLCTDPVAQLTSMARESPKTYAHSQIPLPRDIYRPKRTGAASLNLDDDHHWAQLKEAIDGFQTETARPWIRGKQGTGAIRPLYAPYDAQKKIGHVEEASGDDAKIAFDDLVTYGKEWRMTDPTDRGIILNKTADLIEKDLLSLTALLIHEGGKTARDALNEVREAIDFCRYYSAVGVGLFQQPQTLDGPTGETNQLFLKGRGVFLCISPWNFPLAIFMGQVAAALMAGNTVLAKPARQTPLIAHKAIQLLHRAGLPPRAIAFLPGSGASLADPILKDHRLGGVCMTGSTQTAWSIQKTLGDRRGPILPFIGETGGQNALIVDSSALPEQVVRDVIASAFYSAGQRCSALRLLCLQNDIAPQILTMLTGAMHQLNVCSPTDRWADIGPVIDGSAALDLKRYIDQLRKKGSLIAELTLSDDIINQGHFVAPAIFELPKISDLGDEAFGPILHVVRFQAGDFMSVLRDINALGYGLTFGLHSRIDGRIQTVQQTMDVGNIYINRPITGAVVGVQPFGGNGLSGTGPKAGGPYYLGRFAVEQTLTINTAAQGGNASLMMMS